MTQEPSSNQVGLSRNMTAASRAVLHILICCLVLASTDSVSARGFPQTGTQAGEGPAPSDGTLQPHPGEQSILKVEAPSVTVDVIVTDKKGQHVKGLSAADFVVYEDKTPQRIVTFVPPIAGVSLKSLTAPPSGQESTISRGEGVPSVAKPVESHGPDITSVRFITLVMDLGDLAPSDLKRAVGGAVQYVAKYLAPEDFVAVYWVDESLHLAQPFTQDKDSMVLALDKLSGRVPGGVFPIQARRQTEEQIDQLQTEIVGLEAASTLPDLGPACTNKENRYKCMEFATLRRFVWSQATLQARTVYSALRAIAIAYRDLPGRKNVALFSEGFPHSPDAKPQMAAVIEAANRSNVAFYVVNSSGLTTEYGAAAHTIEPTVNQEAYTMSLWGPCGSTSRPCLSEFDWAEHLGLDIQHDDLGQLATATGGFLVKNQNDLLPGLARVDSDLREFYTLVYQPTNKTYDGSFRTIKVEALKPGLHVRYRQGYWAIPPGQEMLMTPAAAQLLASVTNGTLKSAFSPQVNAVLLLAANGQFAAPVHVSVPTKNVRFQRDPQRNLFHAGITLLIVGRNSAGKLTTVYQRFLNLEFNKKQLDEFQKRQVLDINARLAVPELECTSVQAILQLSGGIVAIGERTVGLNKTESAGPRLTGLLLSNRIEPADGPADPSDPLRGPNFQIYLPAEARFSASDKLTVYFGVFDTAQQPAQRQAHLRLGYTIRQGAREIASLAHEEVAANPGQKELQVLKQFDLRKLPSGSYTLEVKVEDDSGHATTSQSADFIIG